VILQRGASSGIRRLSAGDFGGKLGRHHFRLHQILA
jgi:formylmethanofuran--tetrahydromethanopterin N-formyltransferase